MTTNLPDFTDLGTITDAEAERVMTERTKVTFSRATAPYADGALAQLSRTFTTRQKFEQDLATRVEDARQKAATAEPISAGTLPAPAAVPTSYSSTMTVAQARAVLQRLCVDRPISQLMSGYALKAAETVGTSDASYTAWKACLDTQLAGEQDIRDNGTDIINSLSTP